MKVFRITGSILALATLSVLAACGGGGGGGSVTPPGGGGGGGGGATPTPKTSSSPSTTPTPVQTQNPTPTPSASSSPSGVAVSTYTIQAQTGPLVNPPGGQGWYTSGTTASWTKTAGDTSSGATTASAFQTMGGMSCTATTEPAASKSTYSVHAFVGIYYNGTELTLPQAIGMNTPVEPTQPTANAPTGHPNDNYEVESWACEYNVHTHDYSGLVHIEDVNASQSTSTVSPLSYHPTLKSLLDIWGVQLSSTGLTIPGQATLSGPVAVYYGNQGTNLGPHGSPVSDSYQKATATDGSDVGLAYHTTVWIVIGNLPQQPTGDTGLPKVEWRVEF